METVPKGPGRLQAVKDEMSRLQVELEETESIRREAETVNDPDLIADCTAAEARLRGLISELSAEVSRLQKTSGADALRARLQQLKTSEARARSVLGSGEIPAAEVNSAKEAIESTGSKPLAGGFDAGQMQTPQNSGAAANTGLGVGGIAAPGSPKSTQGQLKLGSPLKAASPNASPQKSARSGGEVESKKPVLSTGRQTETPTANPFPDTSFGREAQSLTPPQGAPTGGGYDAPRWDSGFGESAAFGDHPAARTAPSSADKNAGSRPDSASHTTKTSEASMEVRPPSQTSLDSFGESAFSASNAKPKGPSKLQPGQPASSGFESSAFGAPAFGHPGQPADTSAPKPQPTSLGFGDPAFGLPPTKPDANRNQRGLGQGLGVEEQGKSISFKSSFLKEPGAGMPKPILKPGSEKGGWQAFDAQQGANPPNAAAKGNLAGPDPAKPQLGGDFGSSAFGSGSGFGGSGALSKGAAPSRSATVSPSARSGNPFQDFGEPGGLEPAGSGGSSHQFSQGLGRQASPDDWGLAPQQGAPQSKTPGAFDGFGLSGFGAGPLGADGKPSAVRSPQSQFPHPSGAADPFASANPLQGIQSQQQKQAAPAYQPQHDDFGSFDPFAGPPQQARGFEGPAPPPGAFAPASAASRGHPIRPGAFPVPQRGLQVGNDPFGSQVPPQQFGAGGFAPLPTFGDPSGEHFVVTPSMVIPEADWEAAFAPPKPAQGLIGTPSLTATPQVGPEVDEGSEDIGDPSVWVPMTDHDRARCEQAFKAKFGGEAAGGIGLAQARDLWGRAEISQPLEEVFALADLNSDGRLSHTEFLLYMYLLKVLRKGAKLPKRLNEARISHLLGIDVPSTGLQAKPQKKTESAAVHVATTSGLQALISMGATEEDAKRALFLNGDDQEQAEAWLREQKLLGSRGAPTSAVRSSDKGDSEPAAFEAASLGRQPGSGNSDEEGALMAIKIEKALLQYKKPVDRPLFQVVLRDGFGKSVEPEIDTPPCIFEKSSGVFKAGHTVVFSTPVEKMPDSLQNLLKAKQPAPKDFKAFKELAKGHDCFRCSSTSQALKARNSQNPSDAVVYFELKHWKSKEKKWSTLGWTFVHKETFIKLVDGKPVVRTEAQGLHLYEKPLDPDSHFRQKAMRKLKPLSETPDLFLRVSEFAEP